MPLPHIIPRKILFGNPQRMSPQLSPDATKLAFIAPHQGVLNVWVREGTEDRVVTSDRVRGIRFFIWAPDGRSLIYRQDVGGNEDWHLYQTDVSTGSTRNLTPFEGVSASVVESHPSTPAAILAAINHRNKELHDVYRIDLESGSATLDTQNPGDVVAWIADGHLNVRACVAKLPDGGEEVRVRENEHTPWRTVHAQGPEDHLGIVTLSADGSLLSFASSREANAARLIELDVRSGETRIVAQDDVFDVAGVLEHPMKRVVQAVQFIRQRNEWMVVDESVREDFSYLTQFHQGDLAILSSDASDSVWTVAYVVDNGPVSYYLYDRKRKNASFLFTNRPEIEGSILSPMQPVSFAARDGMQLYAYLTLPEGVEPKNLPAVILVHGGPWARERARYSRMVQWLANRGYAVLQVNFRGSTGFGKAYLNAGNREWAAKMQTDVLDGKNWLIEKGYADANRIAIMGGSYGGYATLVGLSFTPDAFTCGVDIVGPSNLITLIQSIPPYWKPIRSEFDYRMGNADTEPEFLKERSPLFKASNITAPLLIGQGANDPRVKMSESDQIVRAMRENGKQVTYIVFPDEGHGFARPENSMRFYAAAESFLAQHLGGRCEPASEEESVQAFLK